MLSRVLNSNAGLENSTISMSDKAIGLQAVGKAEANAFQKVIDEALAGGSIQTMSSAQLKVIGEPAVIMRGMGFKFATLDFLNDRIAASTKNADPAFLVVDRKNKQIIFDTTVFKALREIRDSDRIVLLTKALDLPAAENSLERYSASRLTTATIAFNESLDHYLSAAIDSNLNLNFARVSRRPAKGAERVISELTPVDASGSYFAEDSEAQAIHNALSPHKKFKKASLSGDNPKLFAEEIETRLELIETRLNRATGLAANWNFRIKENSDQILKLDTKNKIVELDVTMLLQSTDSLAAVVDHGIIHTMYKGRTLAGNEIKARIAALYSLALDSSRDPLRDNMLKRNAFAGLKSLGWDTMALSEFYAKAIAVRDIKKIECFSRADPHRGDYLLNLTSKQSIFEKHFGFRDDNINIIDKLCAEGTQAKEVAVVRKSMAKNYFAVPERADLEILCSLKESISPKLIIKELQRADYGRILHAAHLHGWNDPGSDLVPAFKYLMYSDSKEGSFLSDRSIASLKAVVTGAGDQRSFLASVEGYSNLCELTSKEFVDKILLNVAPDARADFIGFFKMGEETRINASDEDRPDKRQVLKDMGLELLLKEMPNPSLLKRRQEAMRILNLLSDNPFSCERTLLNNFNRVFTFNTTSKTQLEYGKFAQAIRDVKMEALKRNALLLVENLVEEEKSTFSQMIKTHWDVFNEAVKNDTDAALGNRRVFHNLLSLLSLAPGKLTPPEKLENEIRKFSLARIDRLGSLRQKGEHWNPVTEDAERMSLEIMLTIKDEETLKVLVRKRLSGMVSGEAVGEFELVQMFIDALSIRELALIDKAAMLTGTVLPALNSRSVNNVNYLSEGLTRALASFSPEEHRELGDLIFTNAKIFHSLVSKIQDVNLKVALIRGVEPAKIAGYLSELDTEQNREVILNLPAEITVPIFAELKSVSVGNNAMARKVYISETEDVPAEFESNLTGEMIVNHYQVLGVPKNASAEVISKSYRKLQTAYHPDRFMHEGQEAKEYAKEMSQKITKAFEILSGKDREVTKQYLLQIPNNHRIYPKTVWYTKLENPSR